MLDRGLSEKIPISRVCNQVLNRVRNGSTCLTTKKTFP
jgi:hypothetical protein